MGGAWEGFGTESTYLKIRECLTPGGCCGNQGELGPRHHCLSGLSDLLSTVQETWSRVWVWNSIYQGPVQFLCLRITFLPPPCIGRSATLKHQGSLSGVCEIVSSCIIILQLRKRVTMGGTHFNGAEVVLRLWNPQNQKYKEGNTGFGGFTSKTLVPDTIYFHLTSYLSILKWFYC